MLGKTASPSHEDVDSERRIPVVSSTVIPFSFRLYSSSKFESVVFDQAILITSDNENIFNTGFKELPQRGWVCQRLTFILWYGRKRVPAAGQTAFLTLNSFLSKR